MRSRTTFLAAALALALFPAAAAAELPAPELAPPVVRPCTPYGVDVAWAPVPGAAKYEVALRRESEPDATPFLVQTVTAGAPQPASYTVAVDGDGSYLLQGDVTYVATVRALDAADAPGPRGTRPFAMPTEQPAGPAALAGTFSGSTVRLAWQPSPGACGSEVRRDGTVLATLPAGVSSWAGAAPAHGNLNLAVVSVNRRAQPAGSTSAIVSEPLPAIPPQPSCAWRDAALTSASLTQASMASVCLLNHERVRQGLQPLWVDARLQAASENHARDEVARGYFDHTNPDGCNPTCRANAAGYPGGTEENIFTGPRTPAEAVAGWLDSPGHRANILGASYGTIGSGTAVGGKNGTEWVHGFGLVAGPFGAVSGLEPQYQGAADPSGGAGPTTPTTKPATGGSSGPTAATKRAAALRLRSVRVLPGHRLRVALTTVKAAGGGKVRITLRARGRSFSFSGTVRSGKLTVTRTIPRKLRGSRRATLTATFLGTRTVRSATVRRTLTSS